MASFRSRLTFSNVLSAVALFVALGGGALAASTIGGGGKIGACYKTSGKSKGLVRLVASGTKCKPGEKAIAWNQSGPAGAAGAKGAAGAAGAAGTNGTNGAKGDKGDTGAPGSTIVARMVAQDAPLGAGTTDHAMIFSPNTWAQAAGEDQLIMGVLTVTALSNCAVNQGLVVSLVVDGGTPFDTTVVTSPDTRPLLAVPVPPLGPGSSGTHTLTAIAGNSCTGPATFQVNVHVVSFK
jgi:hypothetical protein